jgi:hypothetical protein
LLLALASPAMAQAPVASGLAPVMKFFSGRPQGQIPDRNSWRTKVVSVTAEDDRVLVVEFQPNE